MMRASFRPSAVVGLTSERAGEVLDVLCDAFHDYPVMRYVLGAAPEYDRRLRTLIGFFLAARFLRNDLVLGLPDDSGALASARFAIAAPHHHLNMIGVRRSHAGRGHARTLLEHVHGLADADPGSGGVTLSTETARNVGLYQRFGYRLLGRARVAPELETWAFHRPASGAEPS